MDLGQRRLDVLQRLHRAAGDGTLEHEIAMSRLRRAEAAETADELDVLVTGLDEAAPGVAAEPYPVPSAAPATADPGSSQANPILFRTRWSSLTVQGSWRVPAFIAVDAGYSTVLLDFVGAVLNASVIEVRLRESGGWTKLVVPEGWGAMTGDLSHTWGNVGSHVPEVSQPGMPQLVVNGSLGFGNLTIRNPKPRDVRRLRKYLASPIKWSGTGLPDGS